MSLIVQDTQVSDGYWQHHACGHAERYDCACEPTYHGPRAWVRAGVEGERLHTVRAGLAWEMAEMMERLR